MSSASDFGKPQLIPNKQTSPTPRREESLSTPLRGALPSTTFRLVSPASVLDRSDTHPDPPIVISFTVSVLRPLTTTSGLVVHAAPERSVSLLSEKSTKGAATPQAREAQQTRQKGNVRREITKPLEEGRVHPRKPKPIPRGYNIINPRNGARPPLESTSRFFEEHYPQQHEPKCVTVENTQQYVQPACWEEEV